MHPVALSEETWSRHLRVELLARHHLVSQCARIERAVEGKGVERPFSQTTGEDKTNARLNPRHLCEALG